MEHHFYAVAEINRRALINRQLNSADVVKPVASSERREKRKFRVVSAVASQVRAVSEEVIRQLLPKPFIITWLSRAAKEYTRTPSF